MAKSKKRDVTHERLHTDRPHPGLHPVAAQREQQQEAVATERVVVPAGLQAIEAQRIAAIGERESADTHRVESGIKIDGRAFPRTTVEVIRPKRRGGQ